MENNHVVYQILDEKDEVLYIGSGTRERPEVSRKYSHIPELRSLRERTRVELLYQGLSKKESLEREAKLLRKLCPRLNTLIPRLSKGQHGVVSSHVEFRGSAFESFHSFLTELSETHPKITRRFATTDLDETIDEYFILLHRGTEYFFEFKNEGARGQGLHSWYVPSPSDRSSLLPHEQVELPFVVLVNALSSLTIYPGRSTLRKALENHDVFWKRLDITTYSGDFGSKENLQHCLQVLDAMGGMRRVIGVRSENPEDILELSMRSFANVKFDSYRNKSNFGVLETVAFTKCRSRNDDQKLFRVVMYDKLKEVSVSAKRERQKSGTSGQTENEKVVSPEGVRMDLSRRMRIELQLMAGAFHELSSVLKIAKEGVEGSLEGINVIQSKFLRIAFPDESVFERKKAQLLVSCLKSLHFDWLVFPRAPTEILSRVRGTVPGVEEVFRTWKEQYDKPLLGKNRAHKETDFGFQFTQASLNSCYLALRSVGLDVTKISYLEASSLWANLATACLEKEEYQALTENEELIGFDREPLLTEKQRSSILKAAKKRALSSREVLKSCLSSSVISSNLLGNSVHD